MSNILITGGTGFLGSTLINEILVSSNDTIYALVRGENIVTAKKRLFSTLKKATDKDLLDKTIEHRIKVYISDITQEKLGLEADVIHSLIDNTDVIFNSAAITDLNLPLEKIRKVNVNGAKNVLNFALLCKEKGKLKKLNHISTAYVAGKEKKVFKEKDLDVGQQFNNTYEQSKYEAEKLIYEYREKGIDIDIFRPSIILGCYKDGRTTNFKMFYQPLHFFSLGLFDRIPAIENSKANIINVDIAAKAIFLITTSSGEKNMNYHIASPEIPIFGYVLDIASEYFGFKKPNFISTGKFDIQKEYSFVKRKMIESYIPYFNYVTEFDVKNTMRKLKKPKFMFPDFDERNFIRLFEYCNKTGFIKRKKKNVVSK